MDRPCVKAFDVIQYPFLLSKVRAYCKDDASCALLDLSLVDLRDRKSVTPYPPGIASHVGCHIGLFQVQCYSTFQSMISSPWPRGPS